MKNSQKIIIAACICLELAVAAFAGLTAYQKEEEDRTPVIKTSVTEGNIALPESNTNASASPAQELKIDSAKTPLQSAGTACGNKTCAPGEMCKKIPVGQTNAIPPATIYEYQCTASSVSK